MTLGELWRGKDAMQNEWVVSRYTAVLPNLIQWRKTSKQGAKLLDQISSWDGRKWSSVHWRPFAPIVPDSIRTAVEQTLNGQPVESSRIGNAAVIDGGLSFHPRSAALQQMGTGEQLRQKDSGSAEGKGK